jgi:hypothetical protein
MSWARRLSSMALLRSVKTSLLTISLPEPTTIISGRSDEWCLRWGEGGCYAKSFG